MRQLGRQIANHKGQILTIDYGAFDGAGDTLQAVQNHQYVDPFAEPGKADITAHIRFRDLAEAAALDADFMTQAEFLGAFGAKARLEALCRANPTLAEDLNAGYHRLTAPEQMGELFKVLIQKS